VVLETLNRIKYNISINAMQETQTTDGILLQNVAVSTENI
jgi:hypothetical protein